MESWNSVFKQVFDVAIAGTGYAGFAAAMQCAKQGKSAALIGFDGALLWETGRAFTPRAGSNQEPLWQKWTVTCARRGGFAEEKTDGAIAEIVA